MRPCSHTAAAGEPSLELAYVNIGASCDVGASWALPRWVGLRRALEIAMLGDALGAATAERIGLVNRDLPAQPAAEADAFQACAATGDFRNGVDTFFVRSKPRFEGR